MHTAVCLHTADLCRAWKRSHFALRVEKCLRFCYCVFSHSSQRRKELLQLKQSFSAVLIPCSFIEIRWCSNLTCLETLWRSRRVLCQYFNDNDFGEEGSDIIDLLEGQTAKYVNELLNMLQCAGELTKRLQKKPWFI